MFVDSHSHLSWFENQGEIVARARAAGVEKIIDCAACAEDLKKVLSAAEKFEEVECCFGIHPEYLIEADEKEVSSALDFIERNISHCIGIGEIGLDFKYGREKKQQILQEKHFLQFLELARKHKKPVVVHSRYAERKTLELLLEQKPRLVLMHWFTNSSKLAKQAVGAGFFISTSPLVLFDEQTQKVVENIPLDKLVLETDSPTPFKGKTSYPEWIPRIAGKVAELKGLELKKVEEATTTNAKKLFALE